jgi:hypothetical protein
MNREISGITVHFVLFNGIELLIGIEGRIVFNLLSVPKLSSLSSCSLF